MIRSFAPSLPGALAVSAVLLATAAPAHAQNPRLEPTFGTARLRAGFSPDPYVVEVAPGGVIQTTRGGVRMWVSSAPDFRLHYTGGSLPLTFRVDSRTDTTLLVMNPEGEWVGNDDADGTLNPRLTFRNPQSGQYDVWVGTYSQGAGGRATLFITEYR